MNLLEFSKRLKLSVSTVSKALNGYGDVSETTRKRVVKAAAELGFSPNPSGRRLRRRASETIGFVLSPPQSGFAHPFFLDLLLGIDEALENTP